MRQGLSDCGIRLTTKMMEGDPLIVLSAGQWKSVAEAKSRAVAEGFGWRPRKKEFFD